MVGSRQSCRASLKTSRITLPPVSSMPPLSSVRPSRSRTGSHGRAGNGWAGALQSSKLEPQLRTGRGRGTKECRVEWVSRSGIQVQPPASDAEAVPEEKSVRPVAPHAMPEARIVLAPATHGANQRHDVRGALGIVLGEPLGEQVLDFIR